jgi:signal transduction histidine kinase
VRELLINVAKHAETDRATVTLRIEDYNRLCIEVQDSGRGFDTRAVETQSAGEHFGLLCVRERMEAMNGCLRVKSAVGQGTAVTLSLSLDRDAADGHQFATNERD